MKLMKTTLGDDLHCYEKTLLLIFNGKRKVLSTSLYNGGYHEDYEAVFNHDGTQGSGMPCKMYADTYDEHMSIVASNAGLNPEKVTGMGTAAHMENVVTKTCSFENLNVTAIVTGGIETNGGRVGDPANYYKSVKAPIKHGTINIILNIDANLPEGVINRALVTCTEAKTAAIQELMAGSNYSCGLATGSGTDQTIIVVNAESNIYLEGSGKHSKLGELIGKAVIGAVKGALKKQSGLCPEFQHDALKRWKRFGVNTNSIWERYKKTHENLIMNKFELLAKAEILSLESRIVTLSSLYIHLIDQYRWELLSSEEVIEAGNMLLEQLSGDKECKKIEKADIEAFSNAWQDTILNIVE